MILVDSVMSLAANVVAPPGLVVEFVSLEG